LPFVSRAKRESPAAALRAHAAADDEKRDDADDAAGEERALAKEGEPTTAAAAAFDGCGCAWMIAEGWARERERERKDGEGVGAVLFGSLLFLLDRTRTRRVTCVLVRPRAA
jgi:hypothetical protein